MVAVGLFSFVPVIHVPTTGIATLQNTNAVATTTASSTIALEPEIEAKKIANAIKMVETGGKDNCNKTPGKSGEKGCYQFLPSTFNTLSKKHFGIVKGFTQENEELVAVKTIEELTLKGFKVHDIAKYWNTGRLKGNCSKGVNSKGVKYDSCAYIQKVVKEYNKTK